MHWANGIWYEYAASPVRPTSPSPQSRPSSSPEDQPKPAGGLCASPPADAPLTRDACEPPGAPIEPKALSPKLSAVLIVPLSIGQSLCRRVLAFRDRKVEAVVQVKWFFYEFLYAFVLFSCRRTSL